MPHLRFSAIAFLVLAANCGSLMVIAAPPPPAAFGRLAAMDDVVLSPNGKLLAWSESVGSTVRLAIFDVDARKRVRAIELEGKLKLRDLVWANDATLLLTYSWSRTIKGDNTQIVEIYRTRAVDASGSGMREIPLPSSGEVIALGAPDADSAIVTAYEYDMLRDRSGIDSRIQQRRAGSAVILSAYRVDVRRGTTKRIEAGNPFTYDYAVDSAGEIAARADFDTAKGEARVLAKDGAGWREIYRYPATAATALSLHGVSNDGKSIIASGPRDSSVTKLWLLPIDAASQPSVLLGDENREVVDVALDRFGNGTVGALMGGTHTQYAWLDDKYRSRLASIERSFTDANVDFIGRSADFRRVLARVSGPSRAPIYYLVDYVAKRADVVGEEYPELAGVSLGEFEVISYRARDGYQVPAYLTLPPGGEKSGLPLVVLPHGGPEWRDYIQFDWLVQFLATRGYAVLQPQFRGSSGFGEAHRKAGYRQWGKLMQHDVTDGVKALAERGTIDSRRVCIVGWSYGGYAALAGATLTPGLYRCAASINGVSDLPLMIGAVRVRGGKFSDALAYWKDHIGEPTDPDVIAVSPARRAQAASSSIMLFHAELDSVVPIIQSETMASALKSANKPYEFVRLPGDDHALSTAAMRTTVLENLGPFLERKLSAR
jgi:dipeptidyl aminopeptidase/acylaminoacyl peptidase